MIEIIKDIAEFIAIIIGILGIAVIGSWLQVTTRKSNARSKNRKGW